MNWDLLLQLVLVIIGIGAFVGETRHALKVIVARLDRFEDRLGRIELCLSRSANAQDIDRRGLPRPVP